MLKLYKRNFKVFGIISCSLLLSLSYVGLSFYSVPEKANAANNGGIEEWRTLNDITYMQEMTIDICNKSEVGDSKALIDKRGAGYNNDSIYNSYVVRKLSDGKCWMTQNMNLTGKTISSEDSNVVNEYTIPSSLVWSNPANTSNWTKTPGAFYREINFNGAHYTWFTARAGTTSNGDDNADADICPKGWRLPTGGSTGEFHMLSIKGSVKVGSWSSDSRTAGYWLGGPADTEAAAFFPAAGQFYSQSLHDIGVRGVYWASSQRGDRLFLAESTMNTVGNVEGYYGLSVRCISNPDIHSDPYRVPRRMEVQTDVSVEVGPTLTIDATEGMSGQVDYTRILEGSISTAVSSNLGYTVMLSATNPVLTNETNTENTITPVANTTTLQKGTTGWGIWTGEGTTAETKTYAPITTKATEYYSDTSAAADGIGTVHIFGVGIAVSPSIPNGTYSTVVTVTAANV